jgi:hypothetical protein
VGSGASTVVPANRLGQLLAEARLRGCADLEELAGLSDFTVGELSDFEAGHRVLNDRLVAQLTSLYEIDCGPIIPQRAELTIDLSDNMVSAAGHALPLESAAHDHVLERYLSLVYVLRNHQPGSTVPLRDEDVAILAASLAEREELIEEQLLLAMYQDRQSVRGLTRWFRQRLWVPGAGALVGAVSIGTLVMVSADSGSATETSDAPEPEPDSNNRPAASRVLVLPAASALSLGSEPSSSLPATPPATPPTTITTVTSTATTSVTATPVAPATDSSTTAAPSPTPQSVGAQAEALLPFDWQAALPGWTIVYSGPDPGFRGLTYPYDNSIEMFVRDTDTPTSLAGILAHEIGHAIDVTYLDDGQRDSWRKARSIGSEQWWPDAYASDFQSGAGDFAESFAYWAVGDPTSSQLAGAPTTEQLAVLQDFVDEIL